jgi:hypothetical protein
MILKLALIWPDPEPPTPPGTMLPDIREQRRQ